MAVMPIRDEIGNYMSVTGLRDKCIKKVRMVRMLANLGTALILILVRKGIQNAKNSCKKS